MGKGSNTFLGDQFFPGIILRNEMKKYWFGESQLYAESGLSLPFLSYLTASLSLSGFEWASGIPGTIGGALFMNAGAEGETISDQLLWVDYLDIEGKVHHFSYKELSFAYRYSCFQEMKGCILGASFRLRPDHQARERRRVYLKRRQAREPRQGYSLGCIFKNGEGFSAGSLIDRHVGRGRCWSHISLAKEHANFFLHDGKGSARDFLSSLHEVQQIVLQKSGIWLSPEIRLLQ